MRPLSWPIIYGVLDNDNVILTLVLFAIIVLAAFQTWNTLMTSYCFVVACPSCPLNQYHWKIHVSSPSVMHYERERGGSTLPTVHLLGHDVFIGIVVEVAERWAVTWKYGHNRICAPFNVLICTISDHWPSSWRYDGIPLLPAFFLFLFSFPRWIWWLATTCMVVSIPSSSTSVLKWALKSGFDGPISKSEDLNEIQRTTLFDGMIC